MADPLFSRILRQNGHTLVEKAVDKIVVKKDEPTRFSLTRKIAGAAMLRVATKSVPGAIVVSGLLLAKHLHDRHKAAEAEAEAQAAAKAKPAKVVTPAKPGKPD